MKWKKIESAPKDCDVLIFDPEDGITQAEWDDDLKEWYPVRFDCHGCGCCAGGPPNPTHWMDLPKPPKP